MTMPEREKYTLKHVLVCDDLRQEITGKSIVIGLYNDVIVMKTFPSALAKLVIRIATVVRDTNARNYYISVDAKSGQKVASFNGVMNYVNTGEQSIFAISFTNVLFPQADTYDISFEIDGPMKVIHDFVVRGPQDKEEESRLG